MALWLSTLSHGQIHNLRFYYQSLGLNVGWSASGLAQDLQFHHCFWSTYIDGSDDLKLNNILVNDCAQLLDSGFFFNLEITHLTATNIWYGYLVNPSCNPYDSSVTFKNCLIPGAVELSCRTYDEATDDFYPHVGWVTSSYYNYHIGPSTNLLNPYPFTSAGGANFYLKNNSPFRNVGTTNIDASALANIRTQTTYAPQDGGMPDTNAPDLGYHYPLNEDSDHDGLPDWWELKWFGNYSQSGQNHYHYDPEYDYVSDGLGDYDGDGTSNFNEYLNGTDPNKIRFELGATNDYVNHTSVTVQVDIAGGVPSYYAIFVNQTSVTNWLPFTSTNLTVSLGATDTNYNVVVGLKGLPADAQQTWLSYEFFLDRVPPTLSITNPALANGTATVIKPYLQLQGYANEQLVSLSYDISNAFGLATNLDVGISDRWFDTNVFDFTTNYFRAYDVPLATYANYITLRVTDRAGNEAVSNFNVVLDYTTATVTPVVKLLWPQDGMAVSGTNIFLRGTLSDETGTVVAEVVDGDGITNTITGLVERNGVFWVENVALTGTNQIKLTATDAAGNVTITNFMVKASDLNLTITQTPTGDDLYQPVGSVRGTVSAASTVTVNGITATVEATANAQGTFDWQADNVPNSGEGTATFTAQATPPTAGSGSGSGGTPTTTATAAERGPYVAVIMHAASQLVKSDNATTGDWGRSGRGKGYGASVIGSGADWLLTYKGARTYGEEHPGGWFININKWEGSGSSAPTISSRTITSAPSDETVDHFADPYGDIKAAPDADVTELGWAGSVGHNGYPPTFISHYYADKREYNYDSPDGWHTVLKMPYARTQVKLFTGGKTKVGGQKSLFWINCSAESYGAPPAGSWMHTPRRPIDPSKMTLLSKHPGGDGKLWVALDEDSEKDLTTIIPGVKHFGASPTTTDGVQKYHLQVRALTMGGPGSHPIKNDNGNDYPEYHCVVDANNQIQGATYPILYESVGWTVSAPPPYGTPSTLTQPVYMQATPMFKIATTGDELLVIRGKASGTGYPCTFWSTNSTDGRTGYWSVQATADNPIPAGKVDFYNPLTIDWKIYSPDMKAHIDAGTTKCPVYVSLKPPITSDLYHTVVHLACSQGNATTEADALAHTWSFFSGQSVTTWDTKPLYYYLNQQESATNTALLLLSHEGDCNAFCSLFHKSLQVNGLEANKKGVGSGGGSRYPKGDGTHFKVKNLHSTGTNPNVAPPYNRFIMEDSGIKGQNMPDPKEHMFDVHYIVYPSTSGSSYYDPSYGITATSSTDYTSQAVGAWQPPNSSYWALPSDISPARILDFWDVGWDD